MESLLGTPITQGSSHEHKNICKLGFCDPTQHIENPLILSVNKSAEFLEFSSRLGSDLSSPIPKWNFQGLKPGDRWHLCLQVWLQAWQNDAAPDVYLSSTPKEILKHIDFKTLAQFAVKE